MILDQVQRKRATSVKAITRTVCIGEEVAREESADGEFGRGINFLPCKQSDWQSYFSTNIALRYFNASGWYMLADLARYKDFEHHTLLFTVNNNKRIAPPSIKTNGKKKEWEKIFPCCSEVKVGCKGRGPHVYA